MIALLLEGVPQRGLTMLAGLLLALIAVPLVASDYLLTVLILILYFAYVGQAWNIMMGFAGQLSLGHALYVGLGAYAAAARQGTPRARPRERPGHERKRPQASPS